MVKRAIVAGGRDYHMTPKDMEWLVYVLDQRRVTQLGHGGCSGVDQRASLLVSSIRPRIEIYEFPALWNKRAGRSKAGPERNIVMAWWAAQGDGILVCFPGGRGTRHMTTAAANYGIEVLRSA